MRNRALKNAKKSSEKSVGVVGQKVITGFQKTKESTKDAERRAVYKQL